MASTNKTPNIDLSQFLANDKPSWLGDYNVDMRKIDAAVALNEGNINGAVTTSEAAKLLSQQASAAATKAAQDIEALTGGIGTWVRYASENPNTSIIAGTKDNGYDVHIKYNATLKLIHIFGFFNFVSTGNFSVPAGTVIASFPQLTDLVVNGPHAMYNVANHAHIQSLYSGSGAFIRTQTNSLIMMPDHTITTFNKMDQTGTTGSGYTSGVIINGLWAVDDWGDPDPLYP